jgi:predicted nucleic acid-binding protein
MTLRFLDTNILLYSISRDPTETAKRDRAVALIDAGGNALSVQVLQDEAHLASADHRSVHENPCLIRSVSTRLLIE